MAPQIVAELYLCATEVIVGGPVAVIAGEHRLDINQSVNGVALFKLGYRHSQSRVELRLRLNRHHRNNREQAHQHSRSHRVPPPLRLSLAGLSRPSGN